ncbi:class III lanthionine synthetase LanKC [Streptomyces prasinopilosus]|uniref:class III lanthionine synthetase LanKC n=1 Tax=Streptomyces prasinopilosus TaxID=67344 RepID=UPI000AE0DF8F|nr:class III lanthionine synthetase LanKC [Streptomyces prasinopilosus]
MATGDRQIYCYADQQFFEMPDRWNRGLTPFHVSRRPAPAGWTRTARGSWVQLTPRSYAPRTQGWKVHVSATHDRADEACSIVWDYCVRENVRFKYLAGPEVFLAHNAKYAPRSGSGKLLTVYPDDDERLHEILRDLAKELDGIAGPRVLSDLQWHDSPLFLRYGAFVERYCTDADGSIVPALEKPDGELVPDLRRPVFSVPSWAPVPPFVKELMERRKTQGEFPYRVQKALHFSNAGGVYAAEREADGAPCVLKEARPHAALDMRFGDAVQRLRTEKWALELLDGADGAPRLLDYFSLDSHEFMAMEYVDGVNLWVWMARNHPMLVTDAPTPEDYAAYTAKALSLLGHVERIIDGFHARGLAFGDLHFGNVVVRPDGSVALIDYEAAFATSEEDHVPALGTAGFSALCGRRGRAIDHYCLAALKAALFFPFEKVRALDRSKAAEQLDFIAERFPLPAGFLDPVRRELIGDEAPAGVRRRMALETGPDARRAAAASMASAIAASADVHRTDRLFPGDSELFRTGGAGFAHGAAGILWALDTSGFPVLPAHREWLAEAARVPRPRQGFYDGAHGIAHVLDHLGSTSAAEELLDRAAEPSRQVRSIGLYDGLAGIGLNYLHFKRRWGTTRFDGEITAIAESLSAALRADRPLTGPGAHSPHVRAGLMHGWSGVGLFFLRLHEDRPDKRHLDTAVAAVHRDLDHCIVTANGSLQVEDPMVRTLGYLDVGSAGIALVADEILALHRDDRLHDRLPALLAACASELVLQPQLFTGRAGLLAALERNGRRDPGLDTGRVTRRHLACFDWHALDHGGHLAFPGDFSLKLSMDLATGTAGVLLTAQAVMGAQGSFLPFFTDRPSSGTG